MIKKQQLKCTSPFLLPLILIQLILYTFPLFISYTFWGHNSGNFFMYLICYIMFCAWRICSNPSSHCQLPSPPPCSLLTKVYFSFQRMFILSLSKFKAAKSFMQYLDVYCTLEQRSYGQQGDQSSLKVVEWWGDTFGSSTIPQHTPRPTVTKGTDN